MIKVDLDVLMTLDFQIGLRMDGLTDNANSRVTLAAENVYQVVSCMK